MKWNDGRERALFNKEQKKKRKEYLDTGMTEEQIEELAEFDKEWYRSRRREALHTQRLDMTCNDEDKICDESTNPLLKKFLHSFTIEDKYFENDRLGWLEQLDNSDLCEVIKSFSEQDKAILNVLMKGLTQKEIAEKLGVSQQAISKKIKKFQIIFKKWL